VPNLRWFGAGHCEAAVPVLQQDVAGVDSDRRRCELLDEEQTELTRLCGHGDDCPGHQCHDRIVARNGRTADLGKSRTVLALAQLVELIDGDAGDRDPGLVQYFRVDEVFQQADGRCRIGRADGNAVVEHEHQVDAFGVIFAEGQRPVLVRLALHEIAERTIIRKQSAVAVELAADGRDHGLGRHRRRWGVLRRGQGLHRFLHEFLTISRDAQIAETAFCWSYFTRLLKCPQPRRHIRSQTSLGVGFLFDFMGGKWQNKGAFQLRN